MAPSDHHDPTGMTALESGTSLKEETDGALIEDSIAMLLRLEAVAVELNERRRSSGSLCGPSPRHDFRVVQALCSLESHSRRMAEQLNDLLYDFEPFEATSAGIPH